ncbi:MAG: hypothetical protein HY545_01180 [Candidatus Doudnabacteria bacterium]|nr:hypothetical protein [Candidatus Doudnabacteria bacterium]
MILYLDTVEHNRVMVAVIGKNRVVRVTKQSDYDLSKNFLSLIQDALKKAKIKIVDLEAIAVVTGPGLFSRLRTSIVVANALAYALGLKVIPLSVKDKLNYALLVSRKRLAQVIPKYGKPPNITRST